MARSKTPEEGSQEQAAKSAAGERLRVAMAAARVSASELSKATSVHLSGVSRILAGERTLTPRHAESFAKQLGVSPAWLLGLEGNLPPSPPPSPTPPARLPQGATAVLYPSLAGFIDRNRGDLTPKEIAFLENTPFKLGSTQMTDDLWWSFVQSYRAGRFG